MRRAAVALLLVFVACTSATYDRALTVSLASVTAARESFAKWDADHQIAIAEAAPTKEAAKAALKTYREASDKVWASLTAACGVIAVAATKSDPESIRAAGNAVADVYAALKGIGVIK